MRWHNNATQTCTQHLQFKNILQKKNEKKNGKKNENQWHYTIYTNKNKMKMKKIKNNNKTRRERERNERIDCQLIK